MTGPHSRRPSRCSRVRVRPAAWLTPRLVEFLAELEAAGASDEQDGWVSVWPLSLAANGLALPTTYADIDSNLVSLLRLAARHGLVLVDLNEETVHRPAPGVPVGVKAGDGTRLGALTYERLESIVRGLHGSDPWIVLDRDPEVYVQTLRQEDGTFVLEHRDGSAERHFSSTLPQAQDVWGRMWVGMAGG